MPEDVLRHQHITELDLREKNEAETALKRRIDALEETSSK
jgi:hypothetical protein